MANFDNIIQEINTNLPDNNTQEITAQKVRQTLVDIVNYIDENVTELYNYILQEWYYTDYIYKKTQQLFEFIDLEVSETPTQGYFYDANANLVKNAKWEAWEINLSNYYGKVFWYQLYASKSEDAYIIYKDSEGNIIYSYRLKTGHSASSVYTRYEELLPMPVPTTAQKVFLSNRKASGNISFKTYGNAKQNS